MCTIYEFLCCYICKMTFVLTNSQTIPRKFLAKSSCPVLILCQGLWKQLHSIDDHIPELENAIYKGRKKKKKCLTIILLMLWTRTRACLLQVCLWNKVPLKCFHLGMQREGCSCLLLLIGLVFRTGEFLKWSHTGILCYYGDWRIFEVYRKTSTKTEWKKKSIMTCFWLQD